MKIHSSLKEVIADMDELSWAGTLFTNDSSWNLSPQEAKFIYLEGDDELDDIVEDEKMRCTLSRATHFEPRATSPYIVRKFLPTMRRRPE